MFCFPSFYLLVFLLEEFLYFTILLFYWIFFCFCRRYIYIYIYICIYIFFQGLFLVLGIFLLIWYLVFVLWAQSLFFSLWDTSNSCWSLFSPCSLHTYISWIQAADWVQDFFMYICPKPGIKVQYLLKAGSSYGRLLEHKRPSPTNTFKASTHIISAHISLAKASGMSKSKVRWVEKLDLAQGS